MLSIGLFRLSCFKAYVSTIEKGQVRFTFQRKAQSRLSFLWTKYPDLELS